MADFLTVKMFHKLIESWVCLRRIDQAETWGFTQIFTDFTKYLVSQSYCNKHYTSPSLYVRDAFRNNFA